MLATAPFVLRHGSQQCGVKFAAVGMGRSAEAAGVFRRMLRNAARMPENYRETQREWLALARQQNRPG
jgi:hypothetical protein